MIDRETIKQARQTDLAEFLKSRGEPLKRVGKRYQHRDHNSLNIMGNMFYWNSQQTKGNSLDFVMNYYGWSFEQAVKELAEFNRMIVTTAEKLPEDKPKDLHIAETQSNKRVIAYLCKTRGIDYDIVKQLIESSYLSQDERGNAVFKIYDEQGELVGAEKVGTLSKVRFKSLADGTVVGYGFNVTIGEPTKALFFESPIDLLSFWSINKNKITAHRLVSLAGLREDIFNNTIEKFAIDSKTVYLCVDNDQAGHKFVKYIQSKYEGIKTYIPKICKDWNKELMEEHKLRHNEPKQGRYEPSSRR